MDVATVIAAVNSMPLADRLQIVEAIWDGMAAEPSCPELTDELKQELEGRLAAYEANPAAATPWEEVRARLLARLKRA